MFGWLNRKEKLTVKQELRNLGVVGPITVTLRSEPIPSTSGVAQVEIRRYDQYIDFSEI